MQGYPDCQKLLDRIELMQKLRREDDHETADMEKALGYYKCAALQSRSDAKPRHVPLRVRLTTTAHGDGPYRSTFVTPGDYPCECNPYGAVSVVATNGQMLGLRLDEFEPISWRANLQP